jgi:hypothetical protein
MNAPVMVHEGSAQFEVTPAMLDAGLTAFFHHWNESDHGPAPYDYDMIKAIYSAMRSVEPAHVVVSPA